MPAASFSSFCFRPTQRNSRIEPLKSRALCVSKSLTLTTCYCIDKLCVQLCVCVCLLCPYPATLYEGSYSGTIIQRLASFFFKKTLQKNTG